MSSTGSTSDAPPSPAEALVVLVTAPVDRAGEIADALLERRLIACANLVGPVQSRYRWEGAIQVDEETLMVLKTDASAFEALRASVVELHPYEVPEVLALPVGQGHGPYLDWILRCCRPDGTGAGSQVEP